MNDTYLSYAKVYGLVCLLYSLGQKSLGNMVSFGSGLSLVRVGLDEIQYFDVPLQRLGDAARNRSKS